MSLANLYNVTFDIARPSDVSDPFGGHTAVFNIIETGKKCALQRKSASEIIFSDRETVWANYTLYCDSGLDIIAGDHIVVGSRSFDVKSVENVNQFNLYLEVELLEIV